MVMVGNQMVTVQVDTASNRITRQQDIVTGCQINKHLESLELEELPILSNFE